LFTNLGSDLYSLPDLADSSRLNELWEQRAITDFVVRNEHLEADLIDALTCANIALTDEQRLFILQGKNEKTNTSSRKSMDFYYDAESIELVKNKEAFIISRYGYEPPAL
jgi:hypothetical protein